MEKKVWKCVGITMLAAFAIFIVADYVNTVQHNLLGYDESYNATVAANMARYGQYRVSYPKDIYFYNLITTGTPVLLPTALIFKLFGISNITSALVPMAYSVLAVILVWLFGIKNFKKKNIGYVAATVITGLMVLSDGFYAYISTRLIGEIAALAFVLIAMIFLYRYLETKKEWKLLVSGITLVASFLTKNSMIFIAVSFIGIILIETVITRRLSKKGILLFALGLLLGIMILEPFKMAQLGGLKNYLHWWSDEWQNILNQSSGIDLAYSMRDKFQYLEDIFVGCNKYFCAVMLMLPVLSYLCCVWNGVKRKHNENAGVIVSSIMGTCGASLIIYFILLGGGGLVYARRHEVNAFLVRLSVVYLSVHAIVWLIRMLRLHEKMQRKIFCWIGIIAVAFLAIGALPYSTIKDNFGSYVSKNTEDSYGLQLMNEFLDEVDSLPEDSIFYASAWWQEPDITLFLDREMRSLWDVTDWESEITDHSYFIAGDMIDGITITYIEMALNATLTRVDTSEVDYNRFSTGLDRQDVECFAIYKIELNE